MTVNGVPLSFRKEDRIPFESAAHPNGFTVVDFCLIVDGGAAAVEGCYAGSVLNTFALEADATLPPNEDNISIARAACRNNRLEVRGVASQPDGFVNVDYDGRGNG